MKTIYIVTDPAENTARAYTSISGMARGEGIKRCTSAKALESKDKHTFRNGRTAHRETLQTSKRGGKRR